MTFPPRIITIWLPGWEWYIYDCHDSVMWWIYFIDKLLAIVYTLFTHVYTVSFKEEAGFLGHSLLRRLATNTLEPRAGPDTKPGVWPSQVSSSGGENPGQAGAVRILLVSSPHSERVSSAPIESMGLVLGTKPNGLDPILMNMGYLGDFPPQVSRGLVPTLLINNQKKLSRCKD